MDILSTLFFITCPALLVWVCIRVPLLDKLGTVLLAFASGILLSWAATGTSAQTKEGLLNIQTQVSEIAIALAIPLLVFSVNLPKAIRLAGTTTKSMLIALLTVMAMSAMLALAFEGHLDQLWQIAGMSVGAYTGGGPNMAAIKTAIEGDDSIFVTMTTYDILLSAIYLLFVMSIAKPIFSRFLPDFKSPSNDEQASQHGFEHLGDESAKAYMRLIHAEGLKQAGLSLLFAAMSVGIGFGVAQLFPSHLQSTATIIGITTAGLALSFVPFIHRLTSSFQLGMYLILVFCFTMGSMTDLNILTNLDLALFSYIGLLLLGSLLVHALFCRWLKIDTDTFIITSSAAIMSVPFIPAIAGALRNKEIILPGFAAAIIGYALGNYLGVMMAYLVKTMLY